MRKSSKLSTLVVAMFFTVTCLMGFISPALAQEVQVIVNGQAVIFPDQQPFINQDNRTLVPVRAPMEAAGAKASWNDKTRQVTVTKGDKTAVFTIGSKVYTINGKAMQMDTTAQIAGSRTVFPIRFVAEAIGLTVEWNAQTNTVVITSTTTEVQPGTTPTQPENTNPIPPDEARKPMTSLTPEAKARLMAYPYPVDGNGKQYEVNEKMTVYGRTQASNGQDGYQWILTPVNQNGINNAAHRFISDPDLCYSCNKPNSGERIRGVLQTTKPDGTITEQDVEYGFFYGTVFVKPGEPTIPSHWFSDYDTVYLSAPVKVR